MQITSAGSISFLAATLALVRPIGIILKRTGHNSAECLLLFVPLVNLLASWFFAFKSWPIDNKPNA